MSITRRGALRLAGLSALALAAPVFAEGISLKSLEGELKEDVEALKYDEELLDVGPDSREKNIVDIPKPKKENPVVAAQEKREKQEEKNFDDMVEKEKAEAAKLKAAFKKKMPNY